MAAPKAALIKPFMLEKTEGLKQVVSKTSVNKWIGCLLTNIKKEAEWLPLTVTDYDWDQKKVINQGKPNVVTAHHINTMLEYIIMYAPNCLYQDIVAHAKSLEEI